MILDTQARREVEVDVCEAAGSSKGIVRVLSGSNGQFLGGVVGLLLLIYSDPTTSVLHSYQLFLLVSILSTLRPAKWHLAWLFFPTLILKKTFEWLSLEGPT